MKKCRAKEDKHVICDKAQCRYLSEGASLDSGIANDEGCEVPECKGCKLGRLLRYRLDVAGYIQLGADRNGGQDRTA